MLPHQGFSEALGPSYNPAWGAKKVGEKLDVYKRQAIRQWAGALEGDKLPWRECAGQGSVTLLVGAPLLCHKGAEELRAYGCLLYTSRCV